MNSSARALCLAVLVLAVAAATLLYTGYARNPAGRTSSDAMQLAATASGALAGAATDDDRLLGVAYHQIERDYYKPVDAQALVDGERAGLLAYLKTRRVVGVTLPPVATSGDDEAALDRTLSDAQARYAKQLGNGGANALAQAALRGLLGAPGDPYTEYLSPREIQTMNEALDGGNFGGIGVYIYQLKDGRVIVAPIDDMPAAHAGIKSGDIVVAVDGAPVTGLSLDRVQTMIRGTAGTTVRLHVYPYDLPAKRKTIAIVRKTIEVPTVKAKMEGGVDYVRLSDFGQTSTDEVRKALLWGKARGAKGYILDLRDNGGGFVDAAVGISSFFIPQGTIVSTIDRAGDRTDTQALGDPIGGLQPLVVLVNKYTASASEITSGALQDYRLATILGTKTFGKGVVQTIYPMPDQQGALKITTFRYVTPLGRDIQHKGITPDVTVAQSPDPRLIDTPADKQLAAAKSLLLKNNAR
ncbi:MAG TPA: S41 family peptidase [Candidatus Baltobacteraceae bacterium]